jgi:hypothetical protein
MKMKKSNKGDWITNHPKPFESFWPRRTCKYKVGKPKGNFAISSEELEIIGLIGIYLDEDVDNYFDLPLVKSQKELKND